LARETPVAGAIVPGDDILHRESARLVNHQTELAIRSLKQCGISLKCHFICEDPQSDGRNSAIICHYVAETNICVQGVTRVNPARIHSRWTLDPPNVTLGNRAHDLRRGQVQINGVRLHGDISTLVSRGEFSISVATGAIERRKDQVCSLTVISRRHKGFHHSFSL
jgi:hypothetical protein